MDNYSDIKKRVDCEIINFEYNQQSTESIKELAKLVIKM